MSKPRLSASLVIALIVLVATGWWAAKNFWLIAPLKSPIHVVAPGSDASATAFMLYVLKDDGHDGFSGVRTVDDVQIKGPVPISTPPPPYTQQAKKDKVQGAIVAAVDVDASGNVASVKLTTVSLSRDLVEGLDESVIETLRTWKFKPAMKKAKPVSLKLAVQVNFSLSG